MNETRAAESSRRVARPPVQWPLLVVFLAFVLSRVGYYAAGVRFDMSTLPQFFQFVAPALLKANLGQSLWYLHSQPPMFNLFLGIVLNLFPGHEAAVCAACYVLLGLAFAVTLFLLLRGFGISDGLSAAASALYIASPTVVLYENWLFYAYPVTVLLLLSALLWQRFVNRGRFVDALAFFVCAATVALTWSLFHLVWLFGLAVALLLLRRREWRKVLAAAAIPLLVVTYWYGKNLVQFGQFTGSTWFGMNFARIAGIAVSDQELRMMRNSGAISAVSLVHPFRSPDEYYSAVPKPRPTGIAVLDQEKKPSGASNLNNIVYVAVSRQYGRDALRILAAYPDAYLRGLVEAYLDYFLPASSYAFLAVNNAHIAGFARFVNTALNGSLSQHWDARLASDQPVRYILQGLLNVGWFLFLAYAVVFILGLVLLRRRSLFRALRLPMMFLWLNIAWVTLVSNTVEVGENNRFRFTADPLVFVFLLVVAVTFLGVKATLQTESASSTCGSR